MSPFNSAYLEHQLKRWMRPDAHNFIHPDWRRDVKPGSELWALYERYERKYSPSQPRDDRGRWTSDGGTQLAQNDRSGYPVDLREERQLGGHTIEEHVAKSEGYLLNRVQQQALSTTRRGEYSDGLRVGSFTSLEAANKLVNSTLAQNKHRSIRSPLVHLRESRSMHNLVRPPVMKRMRGQNGRRRISVTPMEFVL
jgi:hypothetical protein